MADVDIEKLRQELLAGLLADRVAPIIPTLEQLRDEILNGPHAAQLSPLWNSVFQPPAPDPPEPDGDRRTTAYNEALGRWRETCRSNTVKRERSGRLTPDGAFDTHALLQNSGRFAALGWAVTADLVMAAHNELVDTRTG